MKPQRASGEPLQNWLLRKYGSDITELDNRLTKLEAKK